MLKAVKQEVRVKREKQKHPDSGAKEQRRIGPGDEQEGAG